MTDQDFADLLTVVEVIYRNMQTNYNAFRHGHELDWARKTIHELRTRVGVEGKHHRECYADYCLLCHPERAVTRVGDGE